LDRARFEVVGVCGNSMGWYTALAASEALSTEDAVRLVDTMGWYQRDAVIGGQSMYPAWDADGRSVPGDVARTTLARARAAGLAAFLSIDLGSHLVLAGDEAGLSFLEAELPKIEAGDRVFPARLPLHSAFHTPLLAPASHRAKAELDLDFHAPTVPLIDGRGFVFRPTWAHPQGLREYTLGAQVTTPYDFRLGLLAALRHTGADVVVVLGPGNSLGGPIARVLVAEGWRGLRDKAAFERAQAEDPALLSFGVSTQRATLVAR
jgi:malonyl CoA-acyl carrier protein transacylase